jgi:hypothetical protein
MATLQQQATIVCSSEWVLQIMQPYKTGGLQEITETRGVHDPVWPLPSSASGRLCLEVLAQGAHRSRLIVSCLPLTRVKLPTLYTNHE